MELRLARSDRKQSKSHTISLEDLHQKYLKHKEHIFYFAPSNTHKDMLGAVGFFAKKGCKAYLSEVQISTDDKDFIYQLHII
ncbi:hypothetical protein HBZC1_03590 [Helicobacter bizzozeronii CIII-1]|uniref:HP0268 domain-containing protein n=1 Tax=Helicobacter bizzozeronii (strain CIII-1) TaxID=1002804 RepID=F8KRG3_HELBC|nr:HP0268 family nuclease [Helicobacter bizzozeronii]CCB79345.1 hypothetical protein HBZC1_03590 [Helicobacter bizzozeronii CIII-1]